MDFINDNGIILEDHYVSRKEHSTLTVVVIQTNLSVAFDTINHEILISKLNHYGIRNKASNIHKSFQT